MRSSQTVCLRRLGKTRGDELGAGSFFNNKKVTAERIVESWSQQTRGAVTGRHVLAIQDTTEVHFVTRPQRRRGLGRCGHGNAHGVLAHVMMAVDADTEACLGLVGGQVWNREGPVASPLRERALPDRESRRWVETAVEAKEILSDAAMVTVISDREGDIYPLWGRVPGETVHVLSRVMSDRRLAGETDASLHTVADSFPVAGTAVLALRARPPAHAARKVRLELRFGEVEIARPVNEKDRALPARVKLRLVDVREVDAPEGIEPLHWRLLTTHDVADAATAWRIVEWYRMRWWIEQLFRVSKSQGLGLEESQLATADGLVRL